MRINLQIHLNIEGNKSMSRGSFTVKREEDIPRIAYEWIRKIKRETGYRNTIIDKVIVNNEKDITDEVREIEQAQIDDELNLPF